MVHDLDPSFADYISVLQSAWPRCRYLTLSLRNTSLWNTCDTLTMVTVFSIGKKRNTCWTCALVPGRVQEAEVTTESISNTARAGIFKKQVFECLLVMLLLQENHNVITKKTIAHFRTLGVGRVVACNWMGGVFNCKWHSFFMIFPVRASIDSQFQSNTENMNMAYLCVAGSILTT